jgi:hypothetical protein
MLQPSTYPEEFPRLKKSELLREQSMLLKQEHNFYRVPLTTFFHNTRNSVGVAMRANRGSGHECTGLNDRSKNTVATTYLADAWNWGAEIFCGCEVKFLEQYPGNGGYVIHFSWHGSGRSEFKDDFKNQLFWVRAVCSGSNICLCLCIFKLTTCLFCTERILFPRSRCPRHYRNSVAFKAARHADVSSIGKELVWQWRSTAIW